MAGSQRPCTWNMPSCSNPVIYSRMESCPGDCSWQLLWPLLLMSVTQWNLPLEVGSNYFSLSPHSHQHDKSSSRFHNFCSSHHPQLTSKLPFIMVEWWWLENKMNHAEDQTEMNNYKIHHLAGPGHGRAVPHHRQHLASLPCAGLRAAVAGKKTLYLPLWNFHKNNNISG